MPSDLLQTCIAAKRDGADFPTVWQTILRGHPLVIGPPVSRLDDGAAVLEVSLINGQRIVHDQVGYRLA
jgi:hypothetical protein